MSERCTVCGWPLDPAGVGCTAGNCSQRPLPKPVALSDPDRGPPATPRPDALERMADVRADAAAREMWDYWQRLTPGLHLDSPFRAPAAAWGDLPDSVQALFVELWRAGYRGFLKADTSPGAPS